MNSVVKLAMVTMIALLALMVVHAEPDDAAISYFESDGNTYEVVGDGQVSLTRTENADLYVPASVYDSNSGIEYSVVSVDTFRNDNLRTVVIEYGIESVFINNCENLVSVDLPTSIKRIEDRAFHLCFSLRDVTIPPGVTYIGEQAFCGTAIESISIPDSVEEMGPSCFSSCPNLKTVSIGADISEIPRWAFNCCYKLSDITFPSTVTSLYDQTTFIGCPTLERIDVDPENTVYSSIDGVLFQGDRLLVVPAAYPVSDYTVPDGTASLNMFILQDNTGHRVATQETVRRLDIGIFFRDCTELARMLKSSPRMAELDRNMRNVRHLFCFDHYVPELTALFRKAIERNKDLQPWT